MCDCAERNVLADYPLIVPLRNEESRERDTVPAPGSQIPAGPATDGAVVAALHPSPTRKHELNHPACFAVICKE